MLDGTTSSVWEWSVIVKSYQKDYKAAVKLVLIDNYWWNVHLVATTVNAATKGSRYAKNILHDFIYWHFLTLKISKYIYTFFLFSEYWKCSYWSVQDHLQRSWLEGHCWFPGWDFYHGICRRSAQWKSIPQMCQKVFKKWCPTLLFYGAFIRAFYWCIMQRKYLKIY